MSKKIEALKKSPVVMGFIFGAMIGYLLTRVASQAVIPDATDKIAGLLSSHPAMPYIMLGLFLLFLTALLIHTITEIKGWVLVGLKVRSSYKRKKWREFKRRYGYIPDTRLK